MTIFEPFLNEFFPKNLFKVDICSVKKFEEAVLSATSGDYDLIYKDICTNSFSHYWDAMNNFIKIQPRWDNAIESSGAFLVAERKKANQSIANLFALWLAYWKKRSPVVEITILDDANYKKSWQKDVILWLNSWLEHKNTPQKDRRCLYLYGDSNTGKTSFIHELLKKQFDSNCVFLPLIADNQKAYQWDGYDNSIYACTVFDEFEFSHVNLDNWKKCVDGDSFKVFVKFSCNRQISVNRPIIIISNYSIEEWREKTSPSQRVYNSIINRCHFVEAKVDKGNIFDL